MALGGQAVTLRVPHAACIPTKQSHVSHGGHHQLKICIYDPKRTLRDVDCDYTLLMFSSLYFIIFLTICPFLGKHHNGLQRVERFSLCRTLCGIRGTDSLIAPSMQPTSHGALPRVIVGGLRTRLRRMGGIFDEKNPNDMIEYHVIRNGVDEEAVLSFARETFAEVTFFPY